MRSKTFKTYLNVCLYKKRCGRYNILSRYFAGEKERISAKVSRYDTEKRL